MFQVLNTAQGPRQRHPAGQARVRPPLQASPHTAQHTPTTTDQDVDNHNIYLNICVSSRVELDAAAKMLAKKAALAARFQEQMLEAMERLDALAQVAKLFILPFTCRRRRCCCCVPCQLCCTCVAVAVAIWGCWLCHGLLACGGTGWIMDVTVGLVAGC